MKDLVIAVKRGKQIKVISQEHRAHEFNFGQKKFTASNGFVIKSNHRPYVLMPSQDENFGEQRNNTLYVRGIDISQDNRIVIAPCDGFIDRLRVAVKEYNERSKDIC